MLREQKNLRIVILMFIGLAMYKAIDNYPKILDFIGVFISLMMSFIWAFFIAYLLNPAMLYMENKFKLNRKLSLGIIYALVVGILALSIIFISPKITKSSGELIAGIPKHATTMKTWLENDIINSKNFKDLGITKYIDSNMDNIISGIMTSLDIGVNGIVSSVISFTSGFFKFILGLIISIYILADKEKFQNSISRSLYAFFGREKTDSLISFSKEVDVIFSNFIIGKLIDSTIIGMICFVGMYFIIKAPYALLLSIIIGVTNMIPYFGPFIGAVPAVIITLFFDPIQALWVALFIFLLQQFDGLYLGPKILGDKVGVTPFWIILAIVIGGGFFGVVGMFLGVPFVAAARIVFQRWVDNKLIEKNIDLKKN